MTDRLRVRRVTSYLLPVQTRMPLKFGAETLTHVTCLRVNLVLERNGGAAAEGWGETPLSVPWVWPGILSFADRESALLAFAAAVAEAWAGFTHDGDALRAGIGFIDGPLRDRWRQFNTARSVPEHLPWLAALVVCSAFDLALHDAYATALGCGVYDWLRNPDSSPELVDYLEPGTSLGGAPSIDFGGRQLRDLLAPQAARRLPAWHLVGGKDPLTKEELTGHEPRDGHPVLLAEWVRQDELKCLKIKLTGTDAAWDYRRVKTVAEIGGQFGVDWFSIDFNCTVKDPLYVTDILDRLLLDEPDVFARILYVEQPFPYDLEVHRIDVRGIAARKPIFMDESAHDWRVVRLGRELGWTGVALKTCKTQSGALLSAAWARSHGMTLMVQDLTNPMLAQIPHVSLAAHVGTIMGVETNSMQFYPEASGPEAAVHPGLYRRTQGTVDLTTIRGPGFGYRTSEIHRQLPDPLITAESD